MHCPLETTMSRRSFTLIVHAPAFLPTVLTALALRLPSFTVEDDRSGSGGWLVSVPMTDLETVRAILDAVPTHMASVNTWAQEV